MKFKKYRYTIYSDLYRVTGKCSLTTFFRQLLIGESFKYIFWMRTCRFLEENKRFKYFFYPIAKVFLRHYRYKLGISIPPRTVIGLGLYIGHFGGIIVNERCVIGNNCNIQQGVTVGQVNRGKYAGCPTIGSDVYIGPGAKIIGKVKIGDNVAIGANCVVTKDIPDNAVVVGIPGRIISYEGSIGYINRTDY